ncbi:MAG: hypothetical protein MR270_00820 [Erysipelotrichaceae bacterium]|nr:hypothetical protein [Erysipelotrichaceae bacterium]
MNEQTLKLDLIQSKVGYILALLSSYPSLDLSKRIEDINKVIYLIKKSIIDQKEYIDIRNVINLRSLLENVKNTYGFKSEEEISYDGHKIACKLFEIALEIKLFVIDNKMLNQDYLEYLSLASEFFIDCGRIINIKILCYDNKSK